jgi:hypothetical protein
MNAVLTEGGQRYFITIVGDASRYCYVYLLKIKDEALNYFKTYKVEVENQLQKKIKRFLGLCLKTKHASICRLRYKTDGGRSTWDTCRDLAACFAWK